MVLIARLTPFLNLSGGESSKCNPSGVEGMMNNQPVVGSCLANHRLTKI